MGYYTEAAKRLITSPMDAPTFLYEAAQTEHKLFEGLIELDFAQVYNESGVITLSEADEQQATDAAEKGSENAIKQIFTKFKETIQHMWETIQEKLREFFAGIQGFFGVKIDKAKAAGCQIKDILYSDYWNEAVKITSLKEADIDAIKFSVNDKEKLSFNATQAFDEKKAAIKQALETLPTTVEKYNEAKNANISPKAVGTLKIEDLQKALSPKGIADNIKYTFGILKKDDVIKNKIDSVLRSAGMNEKQYKQLKFKFSTIYTKYRVYLFGTQIKVTTNTLTIARRNYSTLKRFAAGKITNANEAAIAYNNAMSDFVCEQVFGF